MNVSESTTQRIEGEVLESSLEAYHPDNDQDEICGERRLEGLVDRGICMREAGWGTMHLGIGKCKDHEDKDEQSISVMSDNVYAIDVKHKRLKEFVESEEARSKLGSIDNLDGEILLLRAMIRVTSEVFGEELRLKGEGEDATFSVIESQDPDVLRSHTSNTVHYVNQLSTLIKRKYEILHISGETIPRERVRQYVTSIQIILNNILRDTCSECGHKHGMQGEVLKQLYILGDI